MKFTACNRKQHMLADRVTVCSIMLQETLLCIITVECQARPVLYQLELLE
jgi:hypothetical protein